nr:hypothetical protein HK105_004212 [Polyrhizophydium stewartii]
MADRRATNKYYPPDWDPSKGSLNTFVGQHPLRDRARKLDQGILVIRFEMPFDVWCLHCDKHIGMGVRFNAEKKKIAMYYTSPIFSFRMKCHLCSGWIEIHTDHKNAEFEIISGARRRETEYDAEDIGVIDLKDDKYRAKLADDALFKLEHETADAQRAQEARPRIEQLMDHSDQFWKDPYTLSQKLRKRFRTEKRVREADAADSRAIQTRHGFLFDVLPASKDDAEAAKAVDWKHRDPETPEQKRLRVEASPIFVKKRKGSAAPASADIIRAAVSKGRDKDPFGLADDSADAK